jgi:peptide/nickel transport system substrate-binding protein
LIFTSQGTFYAQLNPTLPPFNDLRVRQAVNFAVDRKRLIALTGGIGEVTCQPLPPNSEAYRAYCPYTVDPNKAGTWAAPDLARARRLVAASQTMGEPVTVYIPSYWPFGDGGARYLVSVLDGLGYRAKYGGVVDYNKLMNKGTQIQAGFAGWATDYASPGGFFDNVLTCAAYKQKLSNNAAIGGFCDPAIDREIARAHALQDTDPQQASILWRKVDHDVTDAAPWVAYTNPGWYQLLSKRTGNFRFNPEYGTLLDQLWVR